MKKRFTKKFLILGVALLLTLSAIGTGTYAWFSMNRKVDASGMTLDTTAPTNMLISVDPTVDSNWKNGITFVVISPTEYMPSSSTNGKDFFAITSSDGIEETGGTIDELNRTVVQLAKVDRYDEDNTYYTEFALYIKAGLQPDIASNLELALRSFTVTETEHHLEKTVRVSVCTVDPYESAVTEGNTGKVTINQDGTVEDSEGHTLTQSTPIIYKYDTTTEVSPIASLSGGNTGTATLGEDNAIAAGTNQKCFEVDYTAEYYTTIIVRIWFEGQHEDCINEATNENVNVTLNWRVLED